MPLSDADKLRELLGEEIPDGGSELDTLFKDERIQDLLNSSPDMDRAVLDGWKAKAAKLSNLVDTTEGNSQKKYSQLLDNAQDMIKLYARSSTGPTEGRTRIGRIRRAPVEW